MSVIQELLTANKDREAGEGIHAGSMMPFGGEAFNNADKTHVRRAKIIGDGVRPSGVGDMWGSYEDMPWIYPAFISQGQWRSGSGVGDDFVSGIWVDPFIVSKHTPGVPHTTAVWALAGYLSGDYVWVVQRFRHWEVLATATAGDNATLAKITGAPTNGEYPVDLYADGKNSASTGEAVVEVLSLHVGEDLPVDTWLIAHGLAVSSTGSDPP